MLCSTIPVSVIGIRFAMAVDPFWKPEQYSMSLSCCMSFGGSNLSNKFQLLACYVEALSRELLFPYPMRCVKYSKLIDPLRV